MTSVDATPTVLLFGVINVLRLLSHGPQIMQVARDQHGAAAISYSRWSIWIAANLSTAAYAWIDLSDPWFAPAIPGPRPRGGSGQTIDLTGL